MKQVLCVILICVLSELSPCAGAIVPARVRVTSAFPKLFTNISLSTAAASSSRRKNLIQCSYNRYASSAADDPPANVTSFSS